MTRGFFITLAVALGVISFLFTPIETTTGLVKNAPLAHLFYPSIAFLITTYLILRLQHQGWHSIRTITKLKPIEYIATAGVVVGTLCFMYATQTANHPNLALTWALAIPFWVSVVGLLVLKQPLQTKHFIILGSLPVLFLVSFILSGASSVLLCLVMAIALTASIAALSVSSRRTLRAVLDICACALAIIGFCTLEWVNIPFWEILFTTVFGVWLACFIQWERQGSPSPLASILALPISLSVGWLWAVALCIRFDTSLFEYLVINLILVGVVGLLYLVYSDTSFKALFKENT